MTGEPESPFSTPGIFGPGHDGPVTETTQPSDKDEPPGIGQASRSRDKTNRTAIYVALIGLLATVGASVFTGFVTYHVATIHTPSPRATTVPTAQLEFSQLQNRHIPFCQVYGGTGTIPAGYSLLMLSTPVNLAGQPDVPTHYSFEGEATEIPPDHWRTDGPLEIGTRGVVNHIEIIGLLMSKALGAYVELVAKSVNPLPSLPPGQKIFLHVITDGKPGTRCS